jgi:hypothetical protein
VKVVDHMLSVLTKRMHTHEDNDKLRNEASDDIEISQQGHRSIGSRNSRKHSVDVIDNAVDKLIETIEIRKNQNK